MPMYWPGVYLKLATESIKALVGYIYCVLYV